MKLGPWFACGGVLMAFGGCSVGDPLTGNCQSVTFPFWSPVARSLDLLTRLNATHKLGLPVGIFQSTVGRLSDIFHT